jgi:hypothetical protein
MSKNRHSTEELKQPPFFDLDQLAALQLQQLLPA